MLEQMRRRSGGRPGPGLEGAPPARASGRTRVTPWPPSGTGWSRSIRLDLDRRQGGQQASQLGHRGHLELVAAVQTGRGAGAFPSRPGPPRRLPA